MSEKDEKDEAEAHKEHETGKEGGLLSALVLGLDVVKSVAGLVAENFPPTPPETPPSPPPPPDSGRAADRPLETESQVQRRERWGTLLVGCSFAVAIVGGITFVIDYWSGGSNLLLGGGLALCLGGIGATLVLWARLLMRHTEATEPRGVLQSSTKERDDTAEAFCSGAHDVRRRRLLKWMSLGAAGLVVSMVLSLMRSLGLSPDSSLFTTVWRRGQRLVTLDGKPVSLGSLEPGSTVTVFPEGSVGSETAQTVLIRVKEQLLQLPSDRASWAPGGYVAYSRVCTHAGCPVGEFEAKNSILLCPCHQSTFDVLRAAVPTGGPAARALPQLPLYADADGTLRAGGGFTSPPGPGFWGIS